MQEPPRDEADLYERALRLAGRTLAEIACALGVTPPRDLGRAKGWAGELIETVLGATGRSRPVPDFETLGIELKTIPVTRNGRPRESTHVCTVPLKATVGLTWETSLPRRKLSRVLWIPIEWAPRLAPQDRRVGMPILWSPTAPDEAILRADWEELMDMITLGRVDEIDARFGTYLQIRPKALDSRALTGANDENGAPQQSMPRGFYLRTRFTRKILDRAMRV